MLRPGWLPSLRSLPWLELLLTLSAASLGEALQIANGHVDPRAIAWLTVAVIALLLAVAQAVPSPPSPPSLPSPPSPPSPPSLPSLSLRKSAPSWRLAGDGALAWAITLATTFQLLLLGTHPPGAFHGDASPPGLGWFHAGIAATAGITWLHLAARRWPSLARLQLPLLLVASALCGVWLIRTSTDPAIDVFMIHKESVRHLLAGGNPYTLTFPNIYPSTQMYGPEQLAGGRLAFGYCYPPVPLVLSIPGYLLGDPRYSQLLATTVTGALLGLMRPGRVGTATAGLFLFTPRFFYVIEHGWTEPFVVLALAATVYCACRAPRFAAVAFGAFLASKQYGFLALPLALGLLAPSGQRARFLVVSTVTALSLTLPLALWDLRAFVWDCLILQFHSPFRPDSLSYLAWLARHGVRQLPSLIGFAMTLPALALGLWRAPRTPSGFAAATALVFLLFFAFNKQAFSNYYFMVIGVIACAIASATDPADMPRAAIRSGA